MTGWLGDIRYGEGDFFHSLIYVLRTLTHTLTPVFLPPQERAELRAEVLEGCACRGLHPDAVQRDHPSRHTPPLLLRPQWGLPSGNCQLGWRDQPQTEAGCKGLLTAGRALSKIRSLTGGPGEDVSQLYLVIAFNLVGRWEGSRCLLSQACCCCFCSVTNSCPILSDPTVYSTSGSTPGFVSPRVCSDSCPLSWWRHSTISSSLSPFSSCPQSFPASRSFPMSQRFTSCGQSIGASASVLTMNMQGWFPLGLTGLISLLSTGLSRVSFCTMARQHQLFGTQPSLWSNSDICTWLLEKP